MDYKEINNDKMKEALIKVETLQKEYEVTLQQYQEAVNNYINTLQTNTSNTDNQVKYTVLKGRSWWGLKGVSEGTVDTQEECETMCSNADKCSGATFNPVKRYCWTRTGDGEISAGSDTDYALIPKQKDSLRIMKVLNDRLLKINSEISKELTNVNPSIKEQLQENNIKKEQLNKSYTALLEQKMEMEKQLQAFYSIEEENTNSNLYVNQENISMRVWILITCLIILFTLRKMYGTVNMPISTMIWAIIILIILTFSLSTPSGFLLWFIFLVFMMLVKLGYIFA
jgi:chromosome segregation ATPase